MLASDSLPIGEVLLEGDTARGEEGHRVSGEELKLAGAGAGSEHRGVCMAEQGAAGLDVVGEAFAELHRIKVFVVGPGLVHDGDDVGLLDGAEQFRLGADRLHQALDVIRGGVLGFFHLHELEIPQEGSEHAGGAVGTCLIPDIGVDAESPKRAGIEDRREAEHRRQQAGQPSRQTLPQRTAPA